MTKDSSSAVVNIFIDYSTINSFQVFCLINLLNMKLHLLYIRNQSVPHSKHFPSVTKTNQLMMYKAKVALCSDIHTKHSTQSKRHVEFLNVKPGGT